MDNLERIAFIFTDWSVNDYRKEKNICGGIGYYRVMKPAQALRERGHKIDVLGREISDWGTMVESFSRLFINYDIVICKQVSDPQTASNLLAAAKHYGKKLIVDLDDNFLKVREDNPAYNNYKVGTKERYALSAFAQLADGLIVSTEPLKEEYLRLNENIDVIPNCNDLRDWHENAKKDDGKIRIGYAGGTSHNADLDMILPAVKKVLKKYKQAKFEVFGAADVAKATEMVKKLGAQADQVQFFSGTPAFDLYPAGLASLGWDIGLAPLVDDEFNRCKSHIKWMEYSAHKIPTIVSPTYPYKEPIHNVATIEDGKTGLFASTTEEWASHLSRLIDSKQERQQLGENAYNHIKDNWQYSQWAAKWEQAIKKYESA